MSKKLEKQGNTGTPWIDAPGVVLYKVRNWNRKTFGLSFSNSEFTGWAEDGREVSGSAYFPHQSLGIPFDRKFTSGKELIFHQSAEMMEALGKCQKGDVIKFEFHDRQPQIREAKDLKTRDEGEARFRNHLAYERDSALARSVREKANGVCGICDRDYRQNNGSYGKCVIEAHHLRQLSDGVRKSAVDDFVAACANCHRMTHALMRKKGVMSVSLKKLRKKFGEPPQ